MSGSGPDGAASWMTISDVFQIAGRGTVFTGRLEGSVPLSLGDMLICDGTSWEVSGIEQFRATLTRAEPGANIGILLRKGPPGEVLQDRTVTFAPGARAAGGQPGKRRWFR